MEPNSETKLKYLELKPELARVRDLYDILKSSKVDGSKEYVELHRDVNMKILKRTWILFTSVLAQKFLKFHARPLSYFGYKFERLLNILSGDNKFNQLLINLLQGNSVVDTESKTYWSAVGNLDKRVHLDANIQHDDIRYFPLLSAMASKIVYENKAIVEATVKDHWKMELLGSYDFYNEYLKVNTTQATIFRDQKPNMDRVIVAFRGTDPFNADAWCADFDISWLSFPNIGKVHSGFMKALGLQNGETWPKYIKKDAENQKLLAYYTIRKELKRIFKKNSHTKFIVTGHSLGGALAVLFPAVLTMHNEDAILERLEAVYTFGQPRVGNGKFGRYMKGKFKEFGVKYHRYVYNNDVIARVPFDNSVLMFKHFGTCILYNSRYIGTENTGELYEYYFLRSPLFIFRQSFDAIGKLMRSLVSPLVNGAEYRESWPLLMVRCLGICFPYVADHNPQDYINAIRLGRIVKE